LPLRAADNRAAHRTTALPIRVLLVEDSRPQRAVLHDMLDSVGDFTVVGELETEAEAVHWLEEHPRAWDLAIVDLILAQGTGMGVVARSGRSRAASSKVVVFSDYASPGIRRHCLQLGADCVFPKNQGGRDLADYCAAIAAGQAPAPMAPGPTEPPT
jgi:DNA-binding NarL/FixJ family response regulator